MLVSRRDLLKSNRHALRRGRRRSFVALRGYLDGASNADTHPVNSGTPTDNLYTRIGVRPIMNARGTFTIISGSQSLPEVKQAMFEASHYYVQMDELMAAVGAEIASHMGAPSAIVTTGCEAAIAAATVACICGTDPERAQAMPYIKARNQVIIPKYSRNPYDFGVRMSGPEIVEVETEEEFRSKLGEHVAMIYRAFRPARLPGAALHQDRLRDREGEEHSGLCRCGRGGTDRSQYPSRRGSDLCWLLGRQVHARSAGRRRVARPQGSLLAAFWNSAPHHNWGRALKVGKEEAMGMLAAVRQWYKRDHEAEQKQWLEWDNYIADAVKDIPSVTTEVKMPDADLSNRAPTLAIHWDAAKVGITGTELVEKLDKGTPRILVAGGHGSRPDKMASSLGIMPYMMQPGDYKIVAETISKYMRNPGHYENPPVYTGPPPTLPAPGTSPSNTFAVLASSSSSCSRTAANFPENRKARSSTRPSRARSTQTT
jgi:seryl-tRNA(Sec) selenium transferase